MGSLKTLPLGHLVSLGKVESWCWSPGLYLGISGKSGGHPDWVGRVGVDLQGVGLECGPSGGLTAMAPVTQMPHGRGLLL